MKQLRHLISLFFLVCFGFLTEPVAAEIITFNFTGAVTSVSGAVFGLSPSIGDPTTGSFSYDTSPSAGYIQPPPSGMSVVISGMTLQSKGNTSLQVLNNSFGVDNFNGFFVPISVNGVSQSNSSSIIFYMGDFTQTVFSSTALPSSLNVASFSKREGSVFDAASGGSLKFSIESLETSAVPIPAAGWLFGSGLAGLLAFKKRHAQRV